MLRWWENDDDLRLATMPFKGLGDREEMGKDQLLQESMSGEGPLRKWKFRVSAETCSGETVCITGSSYALGQWDNNRAMPLKHEDGNIWSGTALLPLQVDVEYRYSICVILEPDPVKLTSRQVIVRRWETNKYPRKIENNLESNVNKHSEPETFGYYQERERVERGWLTSETAIQLKLFNQPIEMWKPKLKNRPIYIKLTPVNLTKSSTSPQEVGPSTLDETLSLETMDLADRNVTWPIVEIAVMNEAEREFHLQEQFGRAVKENDFIIFQILMHNPETVAYLIDFYAYGSNATEDEPPYHVGFSYILPSVLKGSEGQAVAPITSTRQQPIGQITVEYLVVKPIANVQCDMRTSMQREWKETWQGLDVGHRGSGSSFKGEIKQCADVRENTIASLRSAASHGADFVEFDVQLSKDLIPVLYHDFYVFISMKKKNNGSSDSDMLQLPVKDLTLEQLHLLKVYHLEEGRSKHLRFFDDDQEDHQPFPTLQQALEVLEPTVGFNVEIKWTMKLKDGTYELYHPFDLNLYLDTVLEVVLKHAGSRQIVFSCFHPDICSMIRLKQNKYPVMFLTQGITSKYPPYHDERCQTVLMAVHFAVSLGILGINAHTEDLLRDQSQVSLVKQAGLVLFCWGDDNNDSDTIKRLKELGLHAIIYDKIDTYGSKEVKESIFQLEARETQRCMIRAVAEKAERDSGAHKSPLREVEDHYYLNLDKAKLLASCGSTSSCVSLWNDSPQPPPSTSQSTLLSTHESELPSAPESTPLSKSQSTPQSSVVS